MIKFNTYMFTVMLALTFLFVGCNKASHPFSKKQYHTLSKKIGLVAYSYAKYPKLPYYYLDGTYYYGGYYDNGVYHYGSKLYNQGYYVYDGYGYTLGKRYKIKDEENTHSKQSRYHERLKGQDNHHTLNIQQNNVQHSDAYNKLKSLPVR